jgi:hypothetical protein
MPSPSIENQVAHALDILCWDKEQIDAYKAEHDVRSVKKALRPGGDPTQGLPAILSRRTRDCYLETATPFFDRARKLTGKKLLGELLTEDIVCCTLDAEYRDHMPSTLDTVLAAVGKVYIGCGRLGWTRSPSPVTPALRAHVKAYRDDGDVHQPRYGYAEGDALKILEKEGVYFHPGSRTGPGMRIAGFGDRRLEGQGYRQGTQCAAYRG